MSVSITIANEILKLDYIEVVRDVLNSSTVLNHRLEKDYESVQGDQVYIALNTQRNTSFASRALSGVGGSSVSLPTAQEQGYDATFFKIPENYGRLLVREKDIKASRNNKGALIRVLDTEMRHLIRDAKNSLNRQNFGDGTGVIAHVNDAGDPSGATTLTVDAEHTGSSTAAGTNLTYFGTRFMEVGTPIAFSAAGGDPGDAQRANGATTIASVTSATVAVTSANIHADVADNDWVVIDGSGGNDQMGLLGIVDDGVLTRGFVDQYNAIFRVGAPGPNVFWQAEVMRGVGGAPPALRNVTLDMLQQALDKAEVNGDGEVTCFITSYGLRRNILQLLVADKRFVAPYEMDLDGGFRALSYNGVPIIPDRHAPHHTIFALDEPSIRFYQMSDFEWMEEDGAVLNRVADQPTYEATLFLYREMACTDPRNSVRIDDLNDDT